jgi:hypothetical protein
MTTDRNKLLELAKEAGPELRRVIENNDIDTDLERFAALLQAQGEPVVSELPKNCGACPGDGSTCDDVCRLASESPDFTPEQEKLILAAELLEDFGAPLNAADIRSIAADIRSLKRPSQAQEPDKYEQMEREHLGDFDKRTGIYAEPASVSGAVDELHADACDLYDKLIADGFEMRCMDGTTNVVGVIKAAWENLPPALSRAQATQPAQQAPAVSEVERLQADLMRTTAQSAIDLHKAMRNAVELCEHIETGALIGNDKSPSPYTEGIAKGARDCATAIRALLSQPAAAPAVALPKAIGVSRDAESPGEKSVLVAFKERLTDDQLRALHDLLAGKTAAAPVSEQKDKAEQLLGWAIERWTDEVANRPLINVRRRTLDSTWRQVIRYAGGDDVLLVGPRHDDLVASNQSQGGNKP